MLDENATAEECRLFQRRDKLRFELNSTCVLEAGAAASALAGTTESRADTEAKESEADMDAETKPNIRSTNQTNGDPSEEDPANFAIAEKKSRAVTTAMQLQASQTPETNEPSAAE